MALALDAHSTINNDVLSTTASWSHTATGTELVLVVTTSINGVVPVSGITHNGVALTFLGAQDDAALVLRSEIWYLIAPATGAQTIVATWGSSVRKICGGQTFTGADQLNPVGAFVSATGSSTTPSVDVSSAVGEICIDAMTAGNDTATVGAGQTQQHNLIGTLGLRRSCVSTEPGAATPVTMSWTKPGAGPWATGATNVKPVAVPADVDQMSWRPTCPSMIEHWRYYEIVGSGNASS